MGNRYSKPHLNIDDQIALLRRRGLEIGDPDLCRNSLIQIGYYRISAYLYPFRVPKPKTERTTKWNYRFDHFSPGHSYEEAVALYDFDNKLRSLIFEAITLIEISLRTSIAYHAGKHNTFIHLRRDLLDRKACRRVPKRSSEDSYQLWKKKYEKQLDQAKSEDFIRHHLERYDRQVPIWIATEFLDFGSISHLFSFLPKPITNEIARSFGSIEGSVVVGWVRNFNYVRNISAHHSRLWNRLIVTRVQAPHTNVIEPGIFHLSNTAHGISFKKIYPTLALLAYVISFLSPSNDWRIKLAELIDRFPKIEGLDPTIDMGFPSNWKDLAIWRHDVDFVNGAAELPCAHYSHNEKATSIPGH